jgi:hypothetical protein
MNGFIVHERGSTMRERNIITVPIFCVRTTNREA